MYINRELLKIDQFRRGVDAVPMTIYWVSETGGEKRGCYPANGDLDQIFLQQSGVC